MRQSGILPILCQLMAILPRLVDMDFKFVLPSNYIKFDINFEVNQTEIGHSISKNTPKNYQNGHISKPHFAQVSFTKKPTSTTFLSESFRINIYMDFAHTNRGRFLSQMLVF